MRASQLPLFTQKEVPRDIQVLSHKWLIKAGYIQQQSSGMYIFLPFALMVHQKIEQIIREEMNSYGAFEIKMPILTPRELWEQTERWNKMGLEMMRMSDRHGNDFTLSPTHEEAVTRFAKTFLHSYKQLPVNIYQIGQKYRDEMRPRYGLIRCREFVMKDAYSFHINQESLQKIYELMRECYRSIFERCSLDVLSVQADSGTMGGSASEEFMVSSDIGEEVLLLCENEKGCSYRSNQEKTNFIFSDEKINTIKKTNEKFKNCNLEKIQTPNVYSIDAVHNFLGISKENFVRTVVLQNPKAIVIACISGDKDLNLNKLESVTQQSALEIASEDLILKVFDCPSGFLGIAQKNFLSTICLEGNIKKQVYIVVDTCLQDRSGLVVGANQADMHIKNVSFPRDLLSDVLYADIVLAEKGDICPACKKYFLVATKGIEVGHIFQLGSKYTESLDLSVHDSNGKKLTLIMGCYGIGVSRTLATVVEQHCDDLGIIWPKKLSPFQIYLIQIKNNEEQKESCEKLYKLLSKKYDVFFDDRNERAGIKFHDFELTGFPICVVIGASYINEKKIELKVRKTQEKYLISEEVLLQNIQMRLEELI